MKESKVNDIVGLATPDIVIMVLNIGSQQTVYPTSIYCYIHIMVSFGVGV